MQKAADLGYEKGLVHGVEHFITHANSWLTEVKEKNPEVSNYFIKWVKRQGNSLSLVNSGEASSSTSPATFNRVRDGVLEELKKSVEASLFFNFLFINKKIFSVFFLLCIQVFSFNLFIS